MSTSSYNTADVDAVREKILLFSLRYSNNISSLSSFVTLEHHEAEVLAQVTILEAENKLRRMAGVKRREIPVQIVAVGDFRPTLFAPHRTRRNIRPGFRVVIVSADWLQNAQPKLWAAYCARRILTGEPFVMTTSQWIDLTKITRTGGGRLK